MVTFDVEADWAGTSTRGVDRVLPRLVELLDQRSVAATFFVVGELAERVAPHLAGTGHEVGSHGLTHTRLTDLGAAGQFRELRESKRRLDGAGFTVDGFRAPFLATDCHLRERVREAGYTYDASAGRLHPLARRRRPQGSLAVGSMWRTVPFTLTWMRQLGGAARHRLPPSGVLLGHLHDLMWDAEGWCALPRPIRRLHARNAGPTAWALLDAVLADPARRFVTAGEAA